MLAIFAALLHMWALVPVLAHTLLMGVWILTMNTEVCLHYYQELVFAFMLSISYYFVFINPKDKPTKAKYTFHYIVCFFEDLLMLAFWIMKAGNDARVSFWFKLFAALGAWFGWEALIPIILMASILGAVIGIALKFSSNLREGGYIPFGPFLGLAGFSAMFFGPQAILKIVGMATL